MNDFHKFLNTDIKDIPEAPVSKLEKKAMKRRLLGQKKRRGWLLKTAVAAALLFGTGTTMIVAFPTIASQIPVLQNIVSYFDEDELIFNHFSDVAQPLNMTQTSNGSTLTLEEAVYDGTSVTISFALKTETDLGSTPLPNEMINASGSNGYGAAIDMRKVNDTTYAGFISLAPDFRNSPPKSLSLSWEPGAFSDGMAANTEITGDWSFEFKLHALQGVSFNIDETISFEGGQYFMDDISINKLSTVLRFESEGIDENHFIANWQLSDNLGKIYPMVFGSGGASTEHRPYYQITFEAIDPEATTVIIQPMIRYIENQDDEGRPVEIEPIVVELE
ncbi:DUF4179 domain-containing protein [Planococcus sp. CAU13]|uniref:DUF4179 domain-containing protein n=1 Tax=Planococcus sp. CAU13 TaxID=1541197 RepID=UPI00052FF0BA|nr:DUF4179 domain-containing protein [Planococcus sp. CAU13]